MAVPDRTMRADARRNREKLLAAATALFATSGPDVSLEAVAKRAGVGIGTLYRHFATRDALVEAVYRNEVDQLCRAAEDLLGDHPPDVALAEWMDRFVTYAATKRGMSAALQSLVASPADMFADAKRGIREAIGLLLDAGVEAGTLRADIAADDVMRAMGAIWTMADNEQWTAQAHTLLRLLMDGLRVGASGPR